MKYTMVKQFSNAAIDNAFNFVFKFIDFFKVLYEALWAFLEIWIAFFLIFSNIFMYFYYLLLFLIDRGSEQGMPVIRLRKISGLPSSAPGIKISTAANPVPVMYGGAKAAASSAGTVLSSATATAAKALPSMKGSPSGTGAKVQIFKTVMEALADFFTALSHIIVMPFKWVIGLFDRVKESREKEKVEEKPRSLIDEYLREYEKRKK